MRANKPMLHGDITASIIDSFFEVHKELGFGVSRVDLLARARRSPLDSSRAATNLEVGLILHFGRKARFYRVFF